MLLLHQQAPVVFQAALAWRQSTQRYFICAFLPCPHVRGRSLLRIKSDGPSQSSHQATAKAVEAKKAADAKKAAEEAAKKKEDEERRKKSQGINPIIYETGFLVRAGPRSRVGLRECCASIFWTVVQLLRGGW